METRAHHILIGTFAILAFLLGLGFVLWLSKTSADREFRASTTSSSPRP